MGSKLQRLITREYRPGSADGLSTLGTLCPGPIKARTNSLRNPDSLLFRDSTKNRDHSVFENATRVQVGLGEGSECNAIIAQLIKALQGFECTLPGESVQSPEKYKIETAPSGVGHHRLKLGPAGFATGLVVFVLDFDEPSLSAAEFP